jgi:hypothetical protein
MIKTIILSKPLLLHSGVEVDAEWFVYKVVVPQYPEAVIGIILDDLGEGLVSVFAECDDFVAKDLGVVGRGWFDGFDKFKSADIGDDPGTQEGGKVWVTMNEAMLKFILTKRLALGECLLKCLALKISA